MRLYLLFLVALPLVAQLQIFSLQEPTPVPIGASINLGNTATGDSTEFRFRAINNGTGPIPLQSITVGGAGFSLTSAFVPLTLNSAQTYDFAVRFFPTAEGSYSATLRVNAFSTILRTNAVRGPSLFLTAGSQTTELTAASLQVNLATAQSLTLALSVGNPHATPITLTEISLTGVGFKLVNPPAIPLTIAPGETHEIPVNIFVAAEGDATGFLTVGPRRFTIFAVAVRPQLAPPRILPIGDAAPRNGQQLKLQLRLAEPALAAGTGALRATFTGAFEDPAIVFPNGEREIRFEVAAGSRDATFDGAPETVIQTGTTAGTLRLDAITEAGISTESFRFESGPVVVDEALARRNGPALEIDITGFDNTRRAGSLNFRFFDRSGNLIGSITSTPADLFKAYFDQSVVGGVFRIRASFPVTGDATMVGSTLVEIANPVGRTELQRLLFP
jgi:hypothetical protein